MPARVSKGSHVSRMSTYQSMYDKSVSDPDAFFGKEAKDRLSWMRPFEQVLQGGFAQGDVAWFNGGQLNVSANCLDRHPADRIAIIWEGDEPTDVRRITYGEALQETCRFANALRTCGVNKGDRVAIYMPMVPEAAYAMLACTRIGAVHSVVFAGFSAEALHARIIDADCKVVITADHGLRGGKVIPLKQMVDDALKRGAPSVSHVLVHQRTGKTVPFTKGRDVWLHEAMANERPGTPRAPRARRGHACGARGACARGRDGHGPGVDAGWRGARGGSEGTRGARGERLARGGRMAVAPCAWGRVRGCHGTSHPRPSPPSEPPRHSRARSFHPRAQTVPAAPAPTLLDLSRTAPDRPGLTAPGPRALAVCPPVPCESEDPLFLLYTSGSTGKPKGVMHTTAGYLLWAALTHFYVFDYRPGVRAHLRAAERALRAAEARGPGASPRRLAEREEGARGAWPTAARARGQLARRRAPSARVPCGTRRAEPWLARPAHCRTLRSRLPRRRRVRVRR